MTALPAASAFTGSGVTEGEFKTQLTAMRAFLSGLLGADGTQATALTTLGALMNGSVAKSAGYTVVAADRGKLIDCTGTWTLAVDAVATLGAGFAFGMRNGGTGSITINPDLSEQINGVSTLVIGPGESCVVLTNADASGWLAVFVGGGGGTTGQMAYFAMNTAPTGWLKANGAAVSRTTYAALFAAIGTTFGAGDGSTTFLLPDQRGEVMRGFDDGRGVDAGRVFGSWQADEFRSHSHAESGYIGLVAYEAIVSSGADVRIGTRQTGVTGGTETRMRNVAMLACIKY